MILRPAIVLALCLLAGTAPAQIQNQAAPGVPLNNVHPETGLPYWAPGRGVVTHENIRRRALEVLDRQFGAFRDATGVLYRTAQAHCAGDASEEDLRTAFADAWLAWAPLDSYQFGPIEQTGAALTVNFWPDKKGFVNRGLRDLLAKTPEEQADPAVVAAGSAAAQGLPALEMLLFTEAPACPAVVGISGNLDRLAGELYDGWFADGGWADLARAAGPDNPIYLDASEFTKTLYTALDFGLTRIADQRLARPLGTFDRPFPTRAEAWRSGLTEAIIHAQLTGIAEMIEDGFAGDVREPDRAWVLKVIGQTHDRLDQIGQPIKDAVVEPASRVRVEGLQTKVHALQLEMDRDIGPNLGVDTGFSAADGD